MISFDQLYREAVQLPAKQRLALAHKLLISDEPSATAELEKAWDTEIRERISRYDEGITHSRPADEVFSDLDRKLTE